MEPKLALPSLSSLQSLYADSASPARPKALGYGERLSDRLKIAAEGIARLKADE